MNDEFNCYPQWTDLKFTGCRTCQACQGTLQALSRRGLRVDDDGKLCASPYLTTAERKTL